MNVTIGKSAYDSMPAKIGVLAVTVREVVAAVNAGERFDAMGIADDAQSLADLASLLNTAYEKLTELR